MDLDKLKKRLPNASDDHIRQIATIVEKYNIEPNIRNFDSHGFRFIDEAKRIVRVCTGTLREGMVHIQDPHSDIAIVFSDGILSGWISSEKLQDITDRMLVDVRSLNPMPESFNFRQPCAHMSEHGGFYDGEFWQCAGCGQKLIFNDKG